MPLLETKGAASAQGFGLTLGGAAPTYIEDVFSTWLYTGTGATQTITNGIGLSTKGGLVWIKGRSYAAGHALYDTNRGVNRRLITNNTNAQLTETDAFTAFNTNGFTLGADSGTSVNAAGETLASWTFREQPKFFDVVTYTGNGGTQTISHNLGSVPGCIIYKCTSTSNNWIVYHRSLGEDYFLQLNLTSASTYSTTVFDITAPTSTTFTVGSLSSGANVNGQTYVAYLFAHNAGGFGLTGTDNVISCGGYTGNGSTNGPTVTLGYEPQWLMIKRTDTTGDWWVFDSMRGLPVGGTAQALFPNTSASENATTNPIALTATGFQLTNTGSGYNASGGTYIYIAIRRGPMKTPTTGTSVYNATAGTGSASTIVTTGFAVDLLMARERTSINSTFSIDRLRGISSTSSTTATWLKTDTNTAENTSSNWPTFFDNTGFTRGINWGSSNMVFWSFKRAPGFFDEVCYTGNGTAGTAISHNLGVVPELVITKKRSAAASWYSLYQPAMRVILLNNSNGYLDASLTKFYFGNNSADVSPTASTFTVASDADINQSGATYVAYLFASVAGVSKVGSYTGTGALQTINCGFTGGARFVLIKRTDSAGSWYVYDSARGISSGNDPYLLLNSTAAEVTGTNYVDTTSVGFQVTAAAPADLNASGGTYIFLAIA